MSVLYRDATTADAPPLADFMRATFTHTFGHLYPPADLAAFTAEKYGPAQQGAEIADPDVHYRLALKADALVGYCMTGALDMSEIDEPRAFELRRLYVAEAVKGAGVAQTLMDDAIAWARERGAKALYLSVWENNVRAQRFYRRYGFEDWGEHGFMVGGVRDRDLIWRLAL